jgi:hypothetical protein
MLYDSLKAERRETEVAALEIKAWRFGFTGLALSAVTGGLIALYEPAAVYFCSTIALTAGVGIAALMREPPRVDNEDAAFSPAEQARVVLARLGERSLAWYFVLAVAMYVLSHVPYVFGQPFIEQALDRFGLAADAPLVSGGVVAAMMLVSVAASWLALPLTERFGARAVLLAAMALQVLLVGVLAATAHVAAIAILLLRMVPNAFARPLILAGVQPQLASAYRASFLSLQGLVGRLLLAATLFVIASAAPSDGALSHAALQQVLPWYVAVGIALLHGLGWTGRRQSAMTGQS